MILHLIGRSKSEKTYLLEYWHRIPFFHKVVEIPRIHPFPFKLNDVTYDLVDYQYRLDFSRTGVGRCEQQDDE